MQEELIDQQIGVRIEQLRLKFGYTRETVAEQIGISWQHLSNIEKGRRRITLEILMKVQAIFHVPFEFLIYGENEKNDLSHLVAMLNGMDKALYPHFEDMLISFVKALNTDRKARK